MKLTDQEKETFGPMLDATYQAIGYDLPRGISGDDLIEATLDANLPMLYGSMTAEQYDRLMQCYRDPDTMEWLRKVLNY